MSLGGGHVFIDLGGVWIYARSEDVANFGDRLGFGRTGKQTVVADAVEALGEDMQQEATDKLRHLERHGCVATRSLDPVVLDLEGDAVGIGCDQTAVGDGDAMGVAR